MADEFDIYIMKRKLDRAEKELAEIKEENKVLMSECDRLIKEKGELLKKTADVQPVKHGRWIETHISLCKWIPEDEKEEGHNFYMAELKCSCCERYNTNTFSLTLEKPDFCQLCGARMTDEGR